MGGWWLGDLWNSTNGQVMAISWVFWVIGSIVLHELSHGWAAIRAGDRTPIYTGHMTWNPLVHMGSMSLIMFALVGIAWGAMPVNPSSFRGKYDDAKVSAAGPAMNLAIALVCLPIAAVWLAYQGFGAPDHIYTNFMIFFSLGAALNIGLMLFNLLPIPPLDGSRIVASFFPAYDRLISNQNVGIAVFIIVILVLQRTGSKFYEAGFMVTGRAIAWLAAQIHPVVP